MAFFILFLCSLLLAVLTTSIMQQIIDARRRLPPGPWPLPVIGNLLSVGKLPHRSMARLAERYGALMTVRLGTNLVIVASSPSTAREILQKHSASLSGRSSPPDAWRAGGHSDSSIFVLQPRDAKWRTLRRLGMAHLLSPRRLDEQEPLRRDAVRGLLRDVSDEQASPSSSVSVGRVTFAAMVRLLGRAMFSAELDAATAREIEDCVREAIVLFTAPNVSDMFPAVAGADVQGLRRRMSTLIARSYQVMDRQIEQRLQERGVVGSAPRDRGNDLLDVMLDMSQDHQEVGSGLTVDRALMRAFFTDLFGGASDTTSSTIEWAMVELLQNPEIMKKSQEELKSVLGPRTQVEDSDISKLPYLQAIVKEVLRLRSVVPLMLYKAEATVEIQGYTIPQGSNVLVNVWAIHHNAQTWSEPDKFIPERFLQKEIDFFGRNFEFIPFGSGKHICLGLHLANRMLHVILGSLLHQFDLTFTEDLRRSVDMSEKFGLVLSMATPMFANAKKKSH